jgi:hypothetical protein
MRRARVVMSIAGMACFGIGQCQWTAGSILSTLIACRSGDYLQLQRISNSGGVLDTVDA